MLDPWSDSTSVDARVFMYTLQPCVNILWRNSLLKKKFYHCTMQKLLVIANNNLALKYDQVTRVGNMILKWN